MSAAQTRVYRNGVLESEGFPVADISEYLAEPDTVVWVDFCGPSIDQLHELADELGLHELAVEDALSQHQRPKLDHYESHLFLSAHAVRVDTENSELDETEIDAFINSRWIITVRKNEGFSMDPVLRRWDRSGDLAKHEMLKENSNLNCFSFYLPNYEGKINFTLRYSLPIPEWIKESDIRGYVTFSSSQNWYPRNLTGPCKVYARLLSSNYYTMELGTQCTIKEKDGVRTTEGYFIDSPTEQTILKIIKG